MCAASSPKAAPAQGCRPGRGVPQLLPLRLSRAEGERAVQHHDRHRRRTVGAGAPAAPHRDQGPLAPDRRRSAEQSGVPARRLGLDAAGQQAAAGQAGLPAAGPGASPGGSGRDRGVCRGRRPGPAADARDATRRAILAALDRLEAGGSTAGGAGLRLAYEIARQSYFPEGNNRVILATDGDFNVGESSDAGDGPAHRGAARPRHLPHRPRLRHRQPEGQPDGADRRQGQRALRLRGQPQRGAPGVRAGVRRDAGHHRQGREDPGRVQPRQGGGVSAGWLREPGAAHRGLRRRQEGRG